MTHLRFDITGDDDARLRSLAQDMGTSPAAAARQLLIGALHDDALRHPRPRIDGEPSKTIAAITRRIQEVARP